jgi:hypothetical protein
MIYVTYRKYNFNTYIKIHPYVTIEYLKDVTNLVTIVSNGTYQYNSWMKINLKAIQLIG